MNKDRTAVITRITAVILLVSCLFSLSSCYKEPTVSKTNLSTEISDYIKDLTGLDLSLYIFEAEMEVEKGNEERAYIKINLNYNMAKDVTALLKEKTHVDDSPVLKIPAFKNHPYAVEMKEMKITGHYILVKEVDLFHSRDLDIYTARNGELSYVFIFG